MGGPGMGMDDDLHRVVAIVKWVFVIGYWVLILGGTLFAFVVTLLAIEGARRKALVPRGKAWAKQVATRKRAPFEKATAASLAAVIVPIAIAQLSFAAGPLLPPTLAYKIYVYGSVTSGSVALVLAGLTLCRSVASGAKDGRKRAAICLLIASAVLTGFWFASGVAAADHTAPALNDVTTDLDDPPLFDLLADDNHTAAFPAAYVPLVREYYADEIKPLTTLLPIGAAFLRGINVAEEQGYTIVTPIRRLNGVVEPDEWMNKDEILFEATHKSPVFRIPDEMVLRIRKWTFDDGYEGAIVDMRCRSHLKTDKGSNAARIRRFFQLNEYGHW